MDAKHAGIPALFMKNIAGAFGAIADTFPNNFTTLPVHVEKKPDGVEQCTILVCVTNDNCPKQPYYWVVLDWQKQEIVLVKNSNFR
jgi:hypothetical protein